MAADHVCSTNSSANGLRRFGGAPWGLAITAD
jgi:hypothetical protein